MLKTLRAGVAGVVALALLALPLAAHAQLAPIVNDAAVAPVNVSTATTTKVISGAANKRTFVTFIFLLAGGTDNVTFEYGTGSSCAVGTTVLSGPINLTAQTGFAPGDGLGAILTVPAGQDLCLITSGAVQLSGWLQAAQYP